MTVKASVLGACALLLTVFGSAPARAVAPPVIDWDQVANIKDAAVRIGRVQRRQGATKAFEVIVACYKTHGMATKYTKYFEGCIAQDYMHTQMLAALYSRMPPEQLKKAGVPSPKLLAQAMGQRVTGAFAKYAVTPAEANAFKKLVDKHGFPAFSEVVFPKAKPGAKADDPAAPAGDDKSDNDQKKDKP